MATIRTRSLLSQSQTAKRSTWQRAMTTMSWTNGAVRGPPLRRNSWMCWRAHSLPLRNLRDIYGRNWPLIPVSSTCLYDHPTSIYGQITFIYDHLTSTYGLPSITTFVKKHKSIKKKLQETDVRSLNNTKLLTTNPERSEDVFIKWHKNAVTWKYH